MSLFSLSKSELEERFVALGGKAFHARIARREVLERGARSYEEMTGLPKALRDQLAEHLPIYLGTEIERHRTKDKTQKLLIAFPRGENADATVETVFMPSRKKDKGATLCVSTQIGCPVACPFCASGLAGLVRNLSAAEIVEQFARGRSLGELARSVVMGIGEPLLNYDNLAAALEVVREEIGLGSRRITVSTVGFPDRLARIARSEPRFELAISLHTPDDDQRAMLVPAMKDVPVEDVLAAGDDWFAVTGREVTYEYVLLGNENDSPKLAARLAQRLRARRCSVNLIPFNPVEESPFERPSAQRVDAFKEMLESNGVVCTVRWSRGAESDAACGQLRVRRVAADN